MSSLNELINLSQYQAGDVGRQGLKNQPDYKNLIKSPQQMQAQQMKLQMLSAQLAKAEQEQAILEQKKKIWESLGEKSGRDKTNAGIASEVVDNEDLTNGYGVGISSSGNLSLQKDKTKDSKYDSLKVSDRAMKLVDAQLMEEGLNKRNLKASDIQPRYKKALRQAEMDLYGRSDRQEENNPGGLTIDGQVVNPTGLTSDPQDFMSQEKENLIESTINGYKMIGRDREINKGILPEFKEKRGMLQVASDFYTGKKQPSIDSKPDGYGYHVGTIIATPDQGKARYIGNNKWQKVD